MDFTRIEKKWQDKWADTGIYHFDESNLKDKYYLLEMFSYPSGAKLHLGHWWNFGLSDSFGRFKRMQGYNVFHPMGFDAFGLPAENYALKTGIHPEDSTRANIVEMEKQFRSMGGTYDWNYEIVTCDTEYYKWTQWLFIQLYKSGLAYQKYAPVNWCPSCNTVLANEQVIDGKCERCENEVVKKSMTQWFFKITDYAERLLNGLDNIDWPEKTKLLQKNWIGKSVGAEVDFKCENGETITVFTSRADTLYGVSWVVLAPEHPMVKSLTISAQRDEIENYIASALKKDEILRTSLAIEKTGVFTGSYAFNPVNGKKVPIYVADYVLASYATGAVMGVAAHDDRDYDFAIKYEIPILRVIEDKHGEKTTLPFTEHGKLVNSEEFDGLESEAAKTQIVQKLERLNLGRFKTNYKLRDWSVSRQRYWGCPIPMIYCEEHGAVPVLDEQLPVVLPHISDYKPDGRGPLGKVEEYMNTVCPICGKKARRDPDTLDTFICSSWYELRYPSAKNNEVIFDKELTNKICPVDKYVGGIEHATMHLLYSRFITMFLKDSGYLNFEEPFKSLVHQGMVMGPDGKKMSKRNSAKGADDYIAMFGSDALRLHLMFSLKYIDGGPWNDEGIVHMIKFMERIERIVVKWMSSSGNGIYDRAEKELDLIRNNAINEITKSFEDFSFNTAVARMMELINAMYKYDNELSSNADLKRSVAKDIVKLIAPCAPHFAEEVWEEMGQKYSVHNELYPVIDETKMVQDEAEIAVQINSKIVARVNLNTSLSEDEIVDICKSENRVSALLQGKTIVKQIVVKGRIVNFIVK